MLLIVTYYSNTTSSVLQHSIVALIHWLTIVGIDADIVVKKITKKLVVWSYNHSVAVDKKSLIFIVSFKFLSFRLLF